MDLSISSDESNDSDIERLDSLHRQAHVETSPKRSGSKRKRRNGESLSRAVQWTSDMDERLRQCYANFPKDWVKAAAIVGNGVKKDQCRHRWSLHLDPAASLLKKGPWTREEEINLETYVSCHINTKGTKKIPEGMIDWTESIAILGRGGADCQHKWVAMRQATLKKGPWEPDEDRLIIARFIEWGNRGPGLWALLEKEMGRSSRNILSRWKGHLKNVYETGDYADLPNLPRMIYPGSGTSVDPYGSNDIDPFLPQSSDDKFSSNSIDVIPSSMNSGNMRNISNLQQYNNNSKDTNTFSTSEALTNEQQLESIIASLNEFDEHSDSDDELTAKVNTINSSSSCTSNIKLVKSNSVTAAAIPVDE